MTNEKLAKRIEDHIRELRSKMQTAPTREHQLRIQGNIGALEWVLRIVKGSGE